LLQGHSIKRRIHQSVNDLGQFSHCGETKDLIVIVVKALPDAREEANNRSKFVSIHTYKYIQSKRNPVYLQIPP